MEHGFKVESGKPLTHEQRQTAQATIRATLRKMKNGEKPAFSGPRDRTKPVRHHAGHPNRGFKNPPSVRG